MDGQKDVDFVSRRKRKNSGFLLRPLWSSRYRQEEPVTMMCLSMIEVIGGETDECCDVAGSMLIVLGQIVSLRS